MLCLCYHCYVLLFLGSAPSAPPRGCAFHFGFASDKAEPRKKRVGHEPILFPPPLRNIALNTMDLADISTSASTIRALHTAMLDSSADQSSSQPSSPRSSALPSPPDSPSSGSVSSLPSVSSSFFFSSAAASPPHSHAPSDRARESTQGLIIPSLTLPEALHTPTPYGQTLGDLRLLVIGGKDFLAKLLLEDNEDIVDAGEWEDTGYGRLRRASTDWIDHRDAHGLEKYEPTRNVEIHELPGYECNDNVSAPLSHFPNFVADKYL